MSESTAPTSLYTNTTRDVVKYVDPVDAIFAGFMRALHKDGKFSYTELMDKGTGEKLELRGFILRILRELILAPIDEVELLMILMALHNTSDVVKIMWHRTGKGQMIKETYVQAKLAFLDSGIIDG